MEVVAVHQISSVLIVLVMVILVEIALMVGNTVMVVVEVVDRDGGPDHDQDHLNGDRRHLEDINLVLYLVAHPLETEVTGDRSLFYSIYCEELILFNKCGVA